jgi:hypothetical protein
LFLRKHLDAVGAWYAGGTRTEQKALPDLPARLEDARRALERALELWSALAAGPAARLVVDNRDSAACAVTATWVAAGAVTEARLPGRREHARAGDPRRPATGKCSGCGHLLAVPLARLLEPFPCPTCRRPSQFVAVGRPA